MSLPDGTQMPNNPVGTPGQYYPDPMAPDGLQVYAYGFRDVTGYSKQTMFAQKGRMQNAPPILCFDEHDRIKLTLSNLGWAQRPDIPDGHTIHWHGFRNAIPYFDGVPEMSGGARSTRSTSTTTSPSTPARTCTTATGRTWSTCRWA